MNIVFMGTPEFAVASLQALINNKNNVVGVYSQPDKPKGRGHKLQYTPVKEVAVENNIKVFQPTTLRTQKALEEFKALKPDLAVVVAYGKILPKEILEVPTYGCINVHASLLPKYRGAGPIQWSVLNGEEVTGVTTMYMAEGLDTGDMILKSETKIGENETASELHDRLAVIGAELLLDTLKLIEQGNAPRTPQNDDESSYAPMLTKELCPIDFNKNAKLVHNQIRGLSTWPCAVTMLDGKRIKVYNSEVVNGYKGKPGELLDNKKFIVACGDNTAIRFTSVQYEGSKRMNSEDFLRGKQVSTGIILG